MLHNMNENETLQTNSTFEPLNIHWMEAIIQNNYFE